MYSIPAGIRIDGSLGISTALHLRRSKEKNTKGTARFGQWQWLRGSDAPGEVCWLSRLRPLLIKRGICASAPRWSPPASVLMEQERLDFCHVGSGTAVGTALPLKTICTYRTVSSILSIAQYLRPLSHLRSSYMFLYVASIPIGTFCRAQSGTPLQLWKCSFKALDTPSFTSC